MRLFKRIGDIISANFGELAEKWEDPEKMLKQAVREMETSIKDSLQETAKVLANEKKLARELANNESSAKQWHARAEQAVDAGDDDLARKALARKKEHDMLASALREQLAAASVASSTLRTQHEAMKAKLAEAKRNLASLSARKKAADIRKKVYSSMDAESNLEIEDSAFEKFERMRERVEQAEAEADALAELRGMDLEPAIPAESENGEDPVEAELQALKQRKKAE